MPFGTRPDITAVRGRAMRQGSFGTKAAAQVIGNFVLPPNPLDPPATTPGLIETPIGTWPPSTEPFMGPMEEGAIPAVPVMPPQLPRQELPLVPRQPLPWINPISTDSALPNFSWRSKVNLVNAGDLGTIADQELVAVDGINPSFYFHRFHAFFLLDDLSSYLITGRIEFYLEGRVTSSISFDRRSSLLPLNNQRCWAPPQSWRRISNAIGYGADDVQGEASSENAWHVPFYNYMTGSPQYYYMMTSHPIHLTAAYDAVKIICESGTATAVAAGLLGFGLGDYAQNYPFS